jgi:DNA-binding transcriptional LysR family regulator
VRRDSEAVATYGQALADIVSRYELGDLAKQQIIAMTNSGAGSWSFPPTDGSTIPRTVQFTPRLLPTASVRRSLRPSTGVVRPLSYQVAEHIRDGRLQIVFTSDAYAPLPVHIVAPEGRLSVPKVRAFVDFAVSCLRAQFARLTADVGRAASETR